MEFIGTHKEFRSVAAVDFPWQKRYSKLTGTVDSIDDLARLEQFLKTLPRHHFVFNEVTVRTK